MVDTAPEHTDKRVLLVIVAVVGFSIPIATYFWMIQHFAVNVPLADQLDDVRLIGDSYSGHLSLGQLWAAHNENRILFPNLIVLALSRTTHFDIVVEEYLSGILLLVSIAVLVLAHRRRAGPIEWAFYCPVAILMLSLVQYQNSLLGFQLAWYLVLLAAVVSLILLDLTRLTWVTLILSIGSGIVASYSSLQGLIVWPVGLLLLYCRRRPGTFVVVWIAAAVVTTIVYFTNSGITGGNFALHHPLQASEFYFAAIGDVLGTSLTGTNATSVAVICVGLVIFLASCWALVTTVTRGPGSNDGDLIAASLICFGLLFAAVVVAGRSNQGFAAASASRYRTFDLLILVGLYLVLLGRFTVPAGKLASSSGPSGRTALRMEGTPTGATHWSVRIFGVVVITVVCLQVGIGVPTGLAGARTDHISEVQGARTLVNINQYPDNCLGDSFYSPTFRKQMARVLEVHHLSLYATEAADQYRGAVSLPLPTRLRILVVGGTSILRNNVYVDAVPSSPCDVDRVAMVLTSGGRNQVLNTAVVQTSLGWLGTWRTADVANGKYTLAAEAFLATGRQLHSPAIQVDVDNR